MRPGLRVSRLQPSLPFDTGPSSEAKLQDSGGGGALHGQCWSESRVGSGVLGDCAILNDYCTMGQQR